MDDTEQEPLTNPLEIESTETTAMPSISQTHSKTLIGAFFAFTIVVGLTVAMQPTGAGWRFFSWHPFLMVSGFIGMMGSAAITKKLGGYANTKLHGMMASGGLLMAFGGLYVIYRNKEILGKEHITTTHGLAGLITMTGALMVSLAGGIFLHPDFGADKTNKTIRFAHKWFSRLVMAGAWITCLFGLMTLTKNPAILGLFSVPLLILAPLTLI
jgi:hypothetical protein